MGVEYELKYKATREQLDFLRCTVGDGERVYTMHTTYYDTPDLRLSARKYTLRKRMENDTPVCTVKTPIVGKGRGEWETKCNSVEDAIEKLCKLGGPSDLGELVRGGLIPVCGASFTRIAKDVKFPEFTAELALDTGEIFSGEKRIPLTEAELELKSGDPAAMERYMKTLAAGIGLQPAAVSKFRRGLALYKERKNG